jgi:diguanylate cyclase (GGDEF)-like protein
MDKKSKTLRRYRTAWWGLILGLLLIGFLLGLDLYNAYQATFRTEQARLLNNLNIVQVNLSRRLQSTSNAMDVVREEIQAGNTTPAAMNPRLTAMVAAQAGVHTMVWVDRKGSVVASNRRELIGQNFRGSERYTTIRQTADPAVLHLSAPFVTALGNYSMSIGKMVRGPQGRFDGYVLAILDTDYFSALLESILYAPDVHVGLIHSEGKLIFRAPDREKVVGVNLADRPESLFNRFIRSGKEKDVISGMASATQVERIVAFSFVRPRNIKSDKALVASIDRNLAVVLAPWVRDLELRASLFAIITGVTILGLSLYQRRHLAFELLEEEQEDERLAMEKRILQINAELEDVVRQRTAELEKANANLRHLSRHDVLTGLHNRMAANERIHAEFMRMKRTGSCYAVLMLDVDFFKRINDTYGHEAGDHVLKRISEVLKGCLRETDFVARFGGEEFLVLLPDTPREAATQVAEKIRQALARSTDPIAGVTTVSIGLVLASPEHHDENVALNQADARLYAAKKAGRNRVIAA